jgi:hypothetical protein
MQGHEEIQGNKSSGSQGDSELRGHSRSQSPSWGLRIYASSQKCMSRTHSWSCGSLGVRITKSFMVTRSFMARKLIGFHEIFHGHEVHSWS